MPRQLFTVPHAAQPIIVNLLSPATAGCYSVAAEALLSSVLSTSRSIYIHTLLLLSARDAPHLRVRLHKNEYVTAADYA